MKSRRNQAQVATIFNSGVWSAPPPPSLQYRAPVVGLSVSRDHTFLFLILHDAIVREEIFAGIYFRKWFLGHFVGINFHEVGFTKDYAGIDFRKLGFTKDFARNNFRKLGLIKDFTGVDFHKRNLYKDFAGIYF